MVRGSASQQTPPPKTPNVLDDELPPEVLQKIDELEKSQSKSTIEPLAVEIPTKVGSIIRRLKQNPRVKKAKKDPIYVYDTPPPKRVNQKMTECINPNINSKTFCNLTVAEKKHYAYFLQSDE